MEHRPSTTPRHRTLFWAALAIPDQLVPCCFSSASVSRLQLLQGRPLYLFPCRFQVRVWRVVLDAGFPAGVSDPAPLPPQYLFAHWFLSRSLPHIFISALLLPLDFADGKMTVLGIVLNYSDPVTTPVQDSFVHDSNPRNRTPDHVREPTYCATRSVKICKVLFRFGKSIIGFTACQRAHLVWDDAFKMMFTLCRGSDADASCNGQHVCFPSLPPMLLCGFESRLGLESSRFSMWHFLKLVAKGFLQVLRFPPLRHRFMVQLLK